MIKLRRDCRDYAVDSLTVREMLQASDLTGKFEAEFEKRRMALHARLDELGSDRETLALFELSQKIQAES